MNTVNLATNLGSGGISLLYLSGAPTAKLLALLPQMNTMNIGDISRTWLRNIDDEIIDEILISKLSATEFMISGHGGSACTLALLNTIIACDYAQTDKSLFAEWGALFAACKTSRQLNYLAENYAAENPENFASLWHYLRPRKICLLGAVNAGKSSLLNCLLAGDHAFVSEFAGTTYDAVKHYAEIGGFYCEIIDTAGFNIHAQNTELAAQQLTINATLNAEIILLLVALDKKINDDDFAAIAHAQKTSAKKIIVYNKCDLPRLSEFTATNYFTAAFPNAPSIKISCRDHINIEKLRDEIAKNISEYR